MTAAETTATKATTATIATIATAETTAAFQVSKHCLESNYRRNWSNSISFGKDGK
jgi:hypothetical protein